MKWMVIVGGLMAAVAFAPSQAQAGCVSGAVIGGVLGHFVGHHGAVGAAAGCAIGHHRRVVRDRDYGRTNDGYGYNSSYNNYNRY